MNGLRLLIVEDNEQDLITCRDAVEIYRNKKKCEIDIVECKSIEDAFRHLDNSFDGAIIDLKLANEGNEGNQVIQKIKESYFRIPIAILTGTPDVIDNDFFNIGVFKKGDKGARYNDLLDLFWEIYNTGLTRIMGGRGLIEETLNKVFLQSLLPQKDKWILYAKGDPYRTPKALLRYTLSHLIQLLDDDGDRCFPEEVYLSPSFTNRIHTGSIVKEKKTKQMFVVMNPACDLVIHDNDECNTDRILLVEIEKQEKLFPDYSLTNLSNNKKKILEKAFTNKKSLYYHWLPPTDIFEGGFMNFRKLSTFSEEKFEQKFEILLIQISSPFVRDIVSRFSAYYARQGQPDIDYTHFINPPTTKTS